MPRKGVHWGTASPCSVSLPLSPPPPILQPWFTVPWQSCCSASPHPSRCCCFASWDLVYCGPCWASWGPWPWAPFVGTRCYTCCHMYVDPLPYSPARPGGQPLLSQCSRHRTSLPVSQPLLPSGRMGVKACHLTPGRGWLGAGVSGVALTSSLSGTRRASLRT